jgi:steroid delta-isomerase-like uncharacterized protein
MSTKQNKELVHKNWEDWNSIAGDVTKVRSVFDKYHATNYISHDLSKGDKNYEQQIEYFGTMVSAFPDMKISIDDMVAEGDEVAYRYTIQATHKGTFMGIPATGKQAAVKGVEIYKIQGRKIIEGWIIPDYLGMMTQLGVIPSPKT